MPGQIETLLYKIVWDDGAAKKAADAWNRKLHTTSIYGLDLEKIFKKLAKATTSFVIDAGKNFAIFEDTLGHARRTMGLSREETLDLGDALMDLSTSFEAGGLAAGVSSNELAKISGVLGQLGFNVRDNQEQFEGLVTVVAKVGTAFGMASSKAAENLGILKNLYDLPIENIENAASSITALGNTTVATASEIMTIMQRMGGIAGLLGVSAQEAAALASTLREAGVRAGLAGTAMSQIFSRMASDVDRFGEVLKKGGISGAMLRMKIEAGDATGALKDVLGALQNIQAREGKIAATQALKDLGLSGVRVQQTLLALSNNLAGLNKNLAASEKAFRENTAVNDAYQAAIDNVFKKWTQFKNLLDVITKLVGKDLALAFGDFLDKHLIPFTERFKNWLKTSEGAKAIFGRDGMIASGLKYIGELLSLSEEAIFDWLNNLDKWLPPIIQEIKTEFKEAWEETIGDLGEVEIAFETLKTSLQDIKKAIDAIQKAWAATGGIRDTITIVADTAVNTTADILVGTAKVVHETGKYGEALGGVITKLVEMGKTAIYGSVLPDMTKETIELTEKTVKLGKYYEAQTGHLKNIYRTGENTFSNLSRDIQHYHDIFQNSGWKANSNVQYYLTQTGEAVGQLGMAYAQLGEDSKTAGEKAVGALQKMQETTRWEIEAMQKMLETMQGRSPTAMSLGQWQNLSSAQLQDMLMRPGLFTASGALGATQRQRELAGQEYMPSQERPATESMNVTLVVGDQEIGNLVSVINDRKQQEQRRSFGGQGIRPI